MAIPKLHQSAIEFEGFGDKLKVQQQDEQPEVINPETNKPFNLNDPDFPVVKGHRFTVRYWAMPKTPVYMLKYLNEHYDYFNRTRFHGKLVKPKLGLIKLVDAAKFRLRGVWKPASRQLNISPNLFNAPHEGWLNRILIHEMCHQYVTDHEGGERVEGGHGPKWKAAMVRAGLPPLRYDYEKNDTYLKKEVKQQIQKNKETLQFVSDVINRLALTQKRVKDPQPGMTIEYVDRYGMVHRAVVNHKRMDNRWEVQNIKNKKRISVPESNMFNLPNDGVK